MIILRKIQRHAKEQPKKVALIESDIEVTYLQLWQRILSASEYFKTVGSKGDRVMLAANKSVSFVYAYFGAQLAGLITVTVDSAVNSLRLKRIYDSASPIAIYGSLDGVQNEYKVIPFSEIDIDKMVDDADAAFPNEKDMADILFTTGTTGFPKGVVLSHENEYSAATMINEFIGNTCDDVELLALPISHSFGLGRLRCTLVKGGTIDLLGSFANVKKFFREMETRKVTGFGMVPASWNFLKRTSGEKIGQYAGQLKYIEIGSAPMKLEDKETLIRLLPNTRVCMHYGLTEASRSMFICFNEEKNHLNSIGHPSPNVSAKIFGENGEEMPVGEPGELCVKGGHICCAYWGTDKDKYGDSFFGEYFRTGDWGYKDENGYFYLISRKKELINVGGKKVSPIEVEEVINRVDGVVDSACIAVPDEVLGEAVKAFVVKGKEELSEKAIIDYAKGCLEGYKVPVCVEYIDEIPKTSSGKVQRLLLK